MEPELTEKEKFGEELFKRNHNCSFIKALNKSRINSELKDYITKNLFDIKQESEGIGTHLKIECDACYEKFDITDYEGW